MMNKLLIKISLCFFILVFLLPTIQMQETPPAPGIKKIIDRGKLIVAIHSEDQPPFFFLDKNGKLKGQDIEIARGIATEFGVNLEFNREAKAFNDLVDIVAAGKADMAISKLSRTLKRARIIKFSNPYIVFHQALILNRLELAKKAPTNEDIDPFIKDFKGKIGIIANSSYVNYAKKYFPNAKPIEFPTWDDVVEAVFNGEVLAGYRDEMEIRKVIKGRSDASLKVKSVVIKDVTDPIAIAIARENTQLVFWVNLYLEQLNLNLTAEKLLNKYPEIF